MSIGVCCVTGHRELPEDKVHYVEEELRKEIQAAISDGCTRFISGFAEGVDLTFAALVVEQKQRNKNVKLEAALPYRSRLETKDPLFQKLIAQRDSVYVQSETSTHSCYHDRNRYMVLASDRVIAVYDGREKGGTAYTIHFALRNKKEVRVITI